MRKPFTLLEICLAIAIFSIGVLTAMSVLVPAVRWGSEAQVDFSAAPAALSAVSYFNGGGFNDEDKSVVTKKPNSVVYSGKIDPKNIDNDFGEKNYPYAVEISGKNLNFADSGYTAEALVRVYRKRFNDPFAESSGEDKPPFKKITKIGAENVLCEIGEDGNDNKPKVFFEIRVNLLRQSAPNPAR